MPGHDEGFFGGPDSHPPVAEGGPSKSLPDAAKEVIACSVAMATLTSLVVGLRIYCRSFLVRKVGKDDWAIIIGLVFSAAYSVGTSLQANTALGRHMQDLTPQEVTLFLKETYYSILTYNATLSCAKLSILLLYLRIFGSAHALLVRVSYVFLVIVSLVSLWGIFSAVFFCWPVASFWDKSIEASCLPRKPRWFLGASLNIITDFMILVLPLPVITKMSLPRGQKLGLHFVFAVGFFVCIVSILRLRCLVYAFSSTDPSKDNPPLAKWSIIEVNTAIICPCIATLKPLMSRMFPRPLTASHTGGRNGFFLSRGVTGTGGGSGESDTRESWSQDLSAQQSESGTSATITVDERSDADGMKARGPDSRHDVELGKMHPTDR